MGHSEEKIHIEGGSNEADSSTSGYSQKMDTLRASDSSTGDEGAVFCRVCHCVESDIRGDVALGFLDIIPPFQKLHRIDDNEDSSEKVKENIAQSNGTEVKMSAAEKDNKIVKAVSPNGEIFVSGVNVESGPYVQQDRLTELGCFCKNDLSVAHYACALKWFISHGSIICEICGTIARNVRIKDYKKVVASLKDYEALMERTTTGEHTSINMESNPGVDSDAIAAIRRQRLSEISLWFNPQSSSVLTSQENAEQMPNPTENVVAPESSTAKWAVEGTGILVATGLLTLIFAWLIAPRVGKKTAKNGFHILLGGICALTAVVFLRFVVLSRIKYGPARYWAILFVFWFLIFGVWASRTHHIRLS